MLDPASIRRTIPAGAAVTLWPASDGWLLRRIDWPADGRRGRVLVQGGRGDILEKYLETFAHLHARGWSVSAFDWRGQGGSGRMSPDPRVGHVDGFRPFLDDLAALWRDWAEGGEGPAVLLGHSMGGHLALSAMVEGLIRPDAAVLVAPMLGLRSPLGARLGATLAALFARSGDPARSAWKQGEVLGVKLSRQRLLTSDLARYSDEDWWYDRSPDLRLGPPSWGWVAEAFRATAALEADPRLDRLDVPTLFLVADHDRLVDARAAHRIAARLPRAELHRFGPKSAHEILREADPVRLRALALTDEFLDRVAPA